MLGNILQDNKVFQVATPRVARWDETPAHAAGVDATPTSGAKTWDATPSTQTPRRNRWDETPHGFLFYTSYLTINNYV